MKAILLQAVGLSALARTRVGAGSGRPRIPGEYFHHRASGRAAIGDGAQRRLRRRLGSETTPPYGYDIFGQRFDAYGAVVGAEFRINTTTGPAFQGPGRRRTQRRVHGRVDERSRWRPGEHRRYGQGTTPGRPRGTEFPVNVSPPVLQSDPEISVSDAGRYVVTWFSFGQDGSVYGVYGRLYERNGASIGTEFRINTYTTGDQNNEVVISTPPATSWSSGRAWDRRFRDGVFGQRPDPTVAASEASSR